MTTMLWVVHCLDQARSTDRRLAARPDHSARLSSTDPRPLLYGPLVADDGKTALGSLIIVEAADQAEVEQFVRDDPFTINEVWEEIHIHAFAQSQRSPNQIARA
jgi:uncharacterized protein YciI